MRTAVIVTLLCTVTGTVHAQFRAARDGRPLRLGSDTAAALSQSGNPDFRVYGYAPGLAANFNLDSLPARTVWVRVTSTVPVALILARGTGRRAVEVARTPVRCNPVLEAALTEAGRHRLTVVGGTYGDYRVRVDTVRPASDTAACPEDRGWAAVAEGGDRWLPLIGRGREVERSGNWDRETSHEYLVVLDTVQRLHLRLLSPGPVGQGRNARAVGLQIGSAGAPTMALNPEGQAQCRRQEEGQCAVYERTYTLQLTQPGRFVITVRNAQLGYTLSQVGGR